MQDTRENKMKMIMIMMMIMIIFINKKDTLQIMATNIQQSPNLRMPVKSYKTLIWPIINLKKIINRELIDNHRSPTCKYLMHVLLPIDPCSYK